MVENSFFQKYHHRHADKGKQRRHRAHVQRNQLSGDGSADVGAHDDPDGLPQRHHAGVDKAHHHDGGCGGGLDDRSNARTHSYAEKAVRGQFLQNLLHAVACRRLQSGAHHLHTVKKQRQTAQQT